MSSLPPALGTRLAQLAEALDRPVPSRRVRSRRSLARSLERVVDVSDPSQVWLAWSVLAAEVPTDDAVMRHVNRRSARAFVDAVVDRVMADDGLDRTVVIPPVGTVLLDVTTALGARHMTGLRRVVSQTAERWVPEGARAVAWLPLSRGLRFVTDDEVTELYEGRRVEPHDAVEVVIPWRCRYVTAEVFDGVRRANRTRAVARFSQSRMAAIVHDCSPLTLSETRAESLKGSFAHYLSALAYFDHVAANSAATAQEFAGWRQMLAAHDIDGPHLSEVLLPDDLRPADASTVAAMRDRLDAESLPIVAVVGSRQPRKNHLAVLHAAELLWRRGLTFRLVFAGSLAWDSGPFSSRVEQLLAVGRPVVLLDAPSDAELAALYAVARFSVFVSLSEGYGLPAAESLVLGTPVITSDFGSVRQIAEAGGGALLVDPRDDHAIAGAMERALLDDALLAELRAQAKARPARTWASYCARLWPTLVGPMPGAD